MEKLPRELTLMDLIIGQDGRFYVFSDKFFNKKVGWLEYDIDKRSLDFIMEDGEVRNYGIQVNQDVAAHLEHQTHAMLVKGTVDDIKAHAGFTLIVHR